MTYNKGLHWPKFLFRALFSSLLKKCSLLRRSLSYSFLKPQFTHIRSYRKRRTEKERNWTGNQCRISHAIQSLIYGPNIFAMCLLQYPFQIPTIYLVFRQTNSNHLITMISVIKSWKPDVKTTYLGSLSFSFLDFSDVCDALDRISSDRFIFLGWATIFPARNSSNVRCTSCIHKNAYSRNVARKLCNQFMIVFFCC